MTVWYMYIVGFIVFIGGRRRGHDRMVHVHSWNYNYRLPVQSVPITTNVVSL
jgi:hypothetical protein